MHHSAVRANVRCLRRSVRPRGCPAYRGRCARAVTWDVTGQRRLMQRWCTWCRGVVCIMAAPAELEMHRGALGCAGCIMAVPAGSVPSASPPRGAAAPPAGRWSRHAADLGVRHPGCGGCQDVASDPVAL